MVAAIAAPIVGALGGGALASFGVNLALYAATTAASIFIQMSMMEEQSQDIGTKLSAVHGGAVNQSFHLGRKETAGSFVYVGTWGLNGGVPNAFLTRVFCLGDREVAGFEDYVWGGGKKCNYDPEETQIIDGVNVGHPINAFDSGGGHRLWVKFHDGSQTTADNYLVEKFGSGSKAWTEDFVGRGRPYMIVTQKFNKKEQAGEVEIVAVVKNSRLYDWRNDSTNGGSGSQRYGNESTYGVDPGNPAVAIYNIMRGIYQDGEWLFGGQGWPASRFDNDSFTAAANKCDEDVTLAGGGTQKRFRLGGEIDVSEEPWTVIERCLKACNGRLVESGGIFKLYVGGIGASVLDITDDDIIVSEELTARLFPSRDQIANTVTGTYIEPDSGGEAKAFKAKTKQSYLDEDGDVRKTALDLDYVRDNRQAQRLANLALNDNRRFRTFVLALWTPARVLEPCDVISWTSDRFGFSAKKFIVGDVVLREDGIVIVNLREADAADADWETSDEDEFETGVFEDIDPPPQAITATVTSVPFTDDDGKNRRPAIRIEADLDDDWVDCRALRYQVRKRFGDQKMIHRGRSEAFFEADNEDYGDITFTSQTIATMKGKQVQVRYKIEPDSERDTAWSDWADHTITLGNYGIDDDDLDDNALAAPTDLALEKVQDRDEDGKINTFIKMTCTAPAWAGPYVHYVFAVTVGSDTFNVKSDDPKARFRVQKTGVLHTVKVRCVRGAGTKGDWSGDETITPTKKATGPGVATGLTIERKTGANNLKWDRCTDADYKETIIYRNTVSNFSTATEIDRVAGTFYRDRKNLTKGVNYKYWVVHVNWSEVPSSASPPEVNVDYNLITLTDTDEAILSAPTGVTLSQANRDVDLDGTVDIALLGSFSGGVAGATGYEFEISKASTSGGTYTVIESPESPTGKLWFKANTQFWYKLRARAIGWNGTPGNWSSLTSAVQPAGVTGAPANPTSVLALQIDYGMIVSWAEPTELDYAYSEVALKLTNSTPSDSDIVGTTTGSVYRAFQAFNDLSYYAFVRHVNSSGLKSSWVNYGIAWKPQPISHIENGIAGEPAEAYTASAYGSFNTAGQNIQSVDLNHGTDASFVMVHGSFRNTSGSGRQFNVSLYAGATEFAVTPSQQIPDNGYGFIFGIYENPGGSSTTFSLRVQVDDTGNNVSNRRIACVSTW